MGGERKERMGKMRRVILETPYKGDNWKETEENIHFARLCLRDCLLRGESPFASHLLYTQEGVLNDKKPKERKFGIEAGLEWKAAAEATVVYFNRGISKGMQLGIIKAVALGQEIGYRLLRGYKKNLLPRPSIVTITGSSGAGKTTTFARLLDVYPEAKLIKSFTSRGPRDTDLPGEYEYNMPRAAFELRKDEFIWVLEAHGNFYGTTKKSIADAFNPVSPRPTWLMVLVPEAVKLLREYLPTINVRLHDLLSFYLLAPAEDELRKRLSVRGDDKATIQRRIKDCKKWDEDAMRSDIPYIFLRRDGPIENVDETVDQMIEFF